ncbi:hypothetical protein BT96DRAFT_941057 [Gymnopus androsaceus JB14]|uniref:Uncharacterized protein n=1 Tax=Gymnopus androsaceus JB14 TaxID=1447944 RepID=A0A6A4HJE4_9AGAR|nr:hypothetical protein BT96DRAFT_941057 [Gymnopus androsaceus JB14]
MTSRMQLHGVKNNTPPSLIPKARAEQRENRDLKAAEKAAKKAVADEEKSAAADKRAASNKRVAKALDNQAAADADLSAIRPDLQPAKKTCSRKVQPKPTKLTDTIQPELLSAQTGDGADQAGNVSSNTEELLDDIGSTIPELETNPTHVEPADDSDYADLDDDEIAVLRKAKAKRLARQQKMPPKKICLQIRSLEAANNLEQRVIAKHEDFIANLLPSSTDPKRAKNVIGGLNTDWAKTVYGNTKAATSRVSVASSDATSGMEIDLEEVTTGEFDIDATAEALEIERGAKSSGKGENNSKVIEDVKLEPADVNAIAAEERETGKPAKPPVKRRQVAAKSHLPTITANDYKIWTDEVLPNIFEWAAPKQNQFSLNSDHDFFPKVRELWMKHLGSLPHIPATYKSEKGKILTRADHPAIYSLAQQQVRTYQTNVRKNGLRIVGDAVNMMETIEEKKKFVQGLILNDAFLFATPGSTHALSQGLFRGELIMRTFAFHLTWVLSASDPCGDPLGALSLSAAAVLRGLTIWKEGFNSVEVAGKKKSRNNSDSFGEDWAGSAMRLYDVGKLLNEEKWGKIFEASEQYIAEVPKAGAGPSLASILNDARRAATTDATSEFSGHDGAGGEDDPFLLSE